MTVICICMRTDIISIAGGGGFSSKPEIHFAANIFIEDLVAIKLPTVGSSHAMPRTIETGKTKTETKPYKTIDKMAASIHYKYNSYFSTNNIGS